MKEVDKDDYKKGISALPEHIKHILESKLTLNEVEALHAFTIQEREAHKNQSRLDLQQELNGLIQRISDAGFYIENMQIFCLEDQDKTRHDRNYSKPTEKRLRRAANQPSNIYAVQWLKENHHHYQLQRTTESSTKTSKGTGRAEYERSVEKLKDHNIKVVSAANFRCMLAVFKFPNENIADICKNYRAGSPASIWAVPEVLKLG